MLNGRHCASCTENRISEMNAFEPYVFPFYCMAAKGGWSPKDLGAKLNAFAISCHMTTLSIKRLNKVSNDPRRIYDLIGTSPLLSTVIICQLKFPWPHFAQGEGRTRQHLRVVWASNWRTPPRRLYKSFSSQVRDRPILRGWHRAHSAKTEPVGDNS